MSTETRTQAHGNGAADGAETLSVTDNRTGETYEIEITDGTVRAIDFRQIKVSEDDFGLMTYDPAYLNTASCRSARSRPSIRTPTRSTTRTTATSRPSG